MNACVIAISSISGGGKSTLGRKLAATLRSAYLCFDDYLEDADYPEDIGRWIADGADFDEWRSPRFAETVATLKSGEPIRHPRSNQVVPPSPFVVIEEPMGRERRDMRASIDLAVFIDTPLEVGLCRRLLRDYIDPWRKSSAADDPSSEINHVLLSNLQHYVKRYHDSFRPLYLLQQERVRRGCDLVVDGLLEPDAQARQVLASAQALSVSGVSSGRHEPLCAIATSGI